MALPSHQLTLRSAGVLDLDNPPASATMEMLEACRDRIFILEGLLQAEPCTPARPRAVASQRTPLSGAKGAPPAKGLTAAQLSKEKKSIVKEIKKRITPLKFHVGWDQTCREVKFAADRLPAEAAAQILGIPRDSWSAATVSSTLGENDATQALGLEEGELKGSIWQKGGAVRFGRFGAQKARRLGTAALVIRSLKLSYTVKSQRLTGSLVCINSR